MVAKKNRRGFTLMEMLAVVAILAVTAAIVIPSVLHIRKALLFRQRNDAARTIFLTAQRQLIRLRAGGTLEERFGSSREAVPQLGDEGIPPERYVCVGSTDPGFDLLLPEGSEDAQVLIEFSPSTADVYAVFYTEGGSLLQDYTSGRLFRDADRRREALLGYYSGDGLTDAQLGLCWVTAEIAFLDEQEGLVSIRVPTQTESMENLFETGDYRRYVNGLRIDLTISGEQGGVLRHVVKEPGQLIPYTAQPGTGGVNMLCFTVSLDSLTGGSFEDNGAILPGDNVSLAAEITFLPEPEDPLILIRTAVTAGVNPMFASLTESNGGWILAVANGRHLQNLNAIAPEIAEKVETVLICAGEPGKSETQVIDWQETMDYYGGELPFTPIQSPYLFGSGVLENDTLAETDHRRKNADIVGCGTQIKNLRINSDAPFVGLFGYLNTNVDGLYLVDPRISGGEALAVGGLAGAAGEKSCITDCGLISDTEESFVSGSGAVGGLVGFIESSRADTVTVQNCFSTVPVLAGEDARAGGFAGVIRDAYLRGCYASPVAGTDYLGCERTLSIQGSGFASENSGTLRECYVLATVAGEAGFVAENSGTIEACQANVTMEGGCAFVKENTGTLLTSCGWITGAGELTVNGDCRGCYFAELAENGGVALYDEAGQLTGIDNIDALATSAALDQLGDGWNPPRSKPAYPINAELGAYPYPMLDAHYGDWAVPGSGFSCGVLYYERYGDGTVGVTLENLSQHPSGEVRPLQEGLAVLEAGYALYYRTGCQPFDGETEEMKGDILEGLHTAAGLSDLYSICALESSEKLVTVKTADGYDSATLIPLFADTIHQIREPYRIRCQSQLESIALWGDGEFLLEGQITLDESFSGIGDFGGILSGAEGSVILAEGMTVGLTATLTGRLQNIRIEGKTGALTSGLLADTVEGGTISNCHVAAQVQTAAGALVGRVITGRIKGCTVSGAVSGTAGFVGTAEGGHFRNCHVTADCGLPFAGTVTVTGEEVLENATHYADTFLADGRYAQQEAESSFVSASGTVPVYGPVFENCSYLRSGQKRAVTALRYYYQLMPTPGWAAVEGGDAGQMALVTAGGTLLGVNENGQIVTDLDFIPTCIPEKAIWLADGDAWRNLWASDTVITVTGNGTVTVTYAETVSVTVTGMAADGTAVKVTEERTEPRTVQCTLYGVTETTDAMAVYLGKHSILTEEDIT